MTTNSLLKKKEKKKVQFGIRITTNFDTFKGCIVHHYGSGPSRVTGLPLADSTCSAPHTPEATGLGGGCEADYEI